MYISCSFGGLLPATKTPPHAPCALPASPTRDPTASSAAAGRPAHLSLISHTSLLLAQTLQLLPQQKSTYCIKVDALAETPMWPRRKSTRLIRDLQDCKGNPLPPASYVTHLISRFPLEGKCSQNILDSWRAYGLCCPKPKNIAPELQMLPK